MVRVPIFLIRIINTHIEGALYFVDVGTPAIPRGSYMIDFGRWGAVCLLNVNKLLRDGDKILPDDR